MSEVARPDRLVAALWGGCLEPGGPKAFALEVLHLEAPGGAWRPAAVPFFCVLFSVVVSSSRWPPPPGSQPLCPEIRPQRAPGPPISAAHHRRWAAVGFRVGSDPKQQAQAPETSTLAKGLSFSGLHGGLPNALTTQTGKPPSPQILQRNPSRRTRNMLVCRNPTWSFPKVGGPQYRPLNTIILATGTLKKEPHNCGKLPHQVQQQRQFHALLLGFIRPVLDRTGPEQLRRQLGFRVEDPKPRGLVFQELCYHRHTLCRAPTLGRRMDVL